MVTYFGSKAGDEIHALAAFIRRCAGTSPFDHGAVLTLQGPGSSHTLHLLLLEIISHPTQLSHALFHGKRANYSTANSPPPPSTKR